MLRLGPLGFLAITSAVTNRFLAFGIALLLAGACSGQSFLAEIRAEHDPARRSEKALDFADQSFSAARENYDKGLVHKGDENLDYMTAALKECADALDQAHKAKFYKRAELNVADLQRRMRDLLGDLSIQERGWAEYTNRKLEELHDRMLEGVMRK